MSAISSSSSQQYMDNWTQTMSIDELLEERLKERESQAEKTLAEIKPELEKALDEARDPVTYEVFEEPRLSGCGHTLDRETIYSIYNANQRIDEDGDPVIACPQCKEDSSIYTIYYDHAFGQTIDHLKKIEGIFNKNDNT